MWWHDMSFWPTYSHTATWFQFMCWAQHWWMLWMLCSQEPRTAKDVIVHECAPRFATQLFKDFLPGYTLHLVTEGDNDDKAMCLSQHCFGWPEHRPRSYCALTKDSTCELSGKGLQTIHNLFRKPNLDVSSLFCAPKDSTFNFAHYANESCEPCTMDHQNWFVRMRLIWKDKRWPTKHANLWAVGLWTCLAVGNLQTYI